jgi:tetratricopeptide (TPR) repeat protein
MPHADELPASLAGLVRRQALELSPARFDFDTNRLLKVLDTTLAEMRTAQDDAAAASTLEANAPDQSATHITQAQAPGSDASTAQSETLVEPYDDPEYTAALAAYFTERWDTAVDLLTRVLDRYPHHPKTAERLAEAQRQQRLAGWDAASRQAAEQGRWAEAVDALEHIATTQPDLPDIAQRLEHARIQHEITGLQADLRRVHTARQWTAVIAIGDQLADIDPKVADPDGLVTASHAELAEAPSPTATAPGCGSWTGATSQPRAKRSPPSWRNAPATAMPPRFSPAPGKPTRPDRFRSASAVERVPDSLTAI